MSESIQKSCDAAIIYARQALDTGDPYRAERIVNQHNIEHVQSLGGLACDHTDFQAVVQDITIQFGPIVTKSNQ